MLAEAADRDPIVLQAARQHFALRYQLEELVNRHFVLSGKAQGAVPRSDSMEQHIERMWDWLTRRPEDRPERSTLIPLNHPCVVPGGRYGEFYYWDSYFTAVGLLASGRIDRLQDMVDNVADLIRSIGFAPNGTRTYYDSRSQIPFFGHMLRLLAKAQGEAAARTVRYPEG